MDTSKISHQWERPTPGVSGQIRMVDGSHYCSVRWALYLQKMNGWVRFVSIQDHYNLVDREGEREIYPLCADQGIGVMPWSPLARGKLTRDWGIATARSESDAMQQSGIYASESDQAIVEKVVEIAIAGDVPRAQIALAWIMHNPVVTGPSSALTRSAISTTLSPLRRFSSATTRSPRSNSPTGPAQPRCQ